MHDRKLTECDNGSGSGSPETPLKETALEQHPTVHQVAADANGVPEAVPPAPLPPASDTPSDTLEPARGPEHSAYAETAEPSHPMAPGPDASPEAETAASSVSPDADEAGPSDPGDVEAPQTAGQIAPDQDWTELPSETAGEFNANPIELPAPPPAGPEPGPSTEVIRPDWNSPDPAVSEHASSHALPVPPQPVVVWPTPALEVPQARVSATGALADRRSRGSFHLIATAVRYAVIAFCGWLAAMAVLIAIFRFVNPPASALMLIRSAQGVEVDQRWVPLDEISPNLVRAVIASEDGRFCSHWGIDPREVLDAIRDANGGTPRGASTMTMQLAKNLFLWPQQSYVRKALEVPLTLAIDAMWPKSRIAEVYLNVVEWGPGIFGAEAAARRHFDTSAAKLGQRQSALLAVTLPNPKARKPAAPSRMHSRMASTIVARMRSMPTADDCVTEAR